MFEINYFHIFAVAPLFAYIGVQSARGVQLGYSIGIALIVLALIIVAYHSYLIYTRSMHKKEETEGYMRVPANKMLHGL